MFSSNILIILASLICGIIIGIIIKILREKFIIFGNREDLLPLLLMLWVAILIWGITNMYLTQMKP